MSSNEPFGIGISVEHLEELGTRRKKAKSLISGIVRIENHSTTIRPVKECFWLPDDVDAGSFSSVPMSPSDIGTNCLELRRWSFDGKDFAYPEFVESESSLPLLDGLPLASSSSTL